MQVMSFLRIVALLAFAGSAWAAGGLGDPLSEPDAKVLHGVFSPDGKQVACAVDRAGRRHLELRDWTGSVPPVALTTGDGLDDFPCWSPDGLSVVFQSTRGNTTKLYELRLADRKERQLTFGAGDDMHPRVSGSGRFLAFDSNRTGNYDVWILDRTDGRLGQVTFDPGADFHPCWSPDDKALAFTSGRSGRFEIWAQKLGRGRQAVRLTYGPGHQAHPDWSPSGWIAYDADQLGQTKVYVMQPSAAVRAVAAAAGGVPVDALAQASGAVMQVSDGMGNEEFPRFSRQGRHVLVQGTDGPFVSMRIRRVPQQAAAHVMQVAAAGVGGGSVVATGGGEGGKRRLIVRDGSSAPPLVASQIGGPAIAGLPQGAGIGLPGGTRGDPDVRGIQSPVPIAGLPEGIAPAGLGPAPAGPPPTGIDTAYLAGLPPAGTGGTSPTPDAKAEGAGPGPVRPAVKPDGAFVVADFFPKDEAAGVPLDSPISVLFNRGLDLVMEPEKAIELWDGDQKLEVVGQYNAGLKRIDVVPRAPLRPGTWYRVVVKGSIRSQEGTLLGNERTHTFRTAGAAATAAMSSAEFRPQTVVPGRDQRGVAVNAKIQVTFTRKLDLSTLDATSLKLTDASGKQVLGELFAPPGDATLTLTPYKPLAEGREYKVVLGEKVRSATGDGLQGVDREWQFRTFSRKAFAVVSVAPAVLEAGGKVRIRFTKPVDLRSVARGRVELAGDGATFSGRVSTADGGEVLVLQPYQSLPEGQVFTVRLPVGITDDEGHELKAGGPKLVVRTKPKKTMAAQGNSLPVLGLPKAAGAAKANDKLLVKHGMPAPGAPIITHYFGAKDEGKKPARPGANWIYLGLRDLARRGYLGDDADPAKIGEGMTRWKLAEMVAVVGGKFETLDLQDRQLVRRLQKEFARELAGQGLDTKPRRI
jgi:Tol biopolymer transport system component